MVLASELQKLLGCHELQLQTHPRMSVLPEKLGKSSRGSCTVVLTTRVSGCTGVEVVGGTLPSLWKSYPSVLSLKEMQCL